MKKSIKALMTGLLFVPMFALGVSLVSPMMGTVSAAPDINGGASSGAKAAQGTGQPDSLFDSSTGIFVKVTNAALYVIGAVAVLMLIYGGVRYLISGGDSAAVTAAKNTILYAVVGIIVSLMAYALVNFVIGQIAV